MNRLRGLRKDILDPVPDLVYILHHLGQRRIIKQRKKEQEADDNKEVLIIADQLPVQINSRLLLHIQRHQEFYEHLREGIVIDTVDHIIENESSDQDRQRGDQDRLEQYAELQLAIVILQSCTLLPIPS